MKIDMCVSLEEIIFSMLNRDNILRATGNGLHIFRHYISGDWKINTDFLNPLYHDTNPSCRIYQDRKSKIYRMKDHGNDFYTGDSFDIVGKIKGLDSNMPDDFKKIMSIINQDMQLHLNEGDRNSYKRSMNINKSSKCTKEVTTSNDTDVTQKKTLPKEPAEYDYEVKPFSQSELAMWRSYGITEEILMQYRVRSLAKFNSVSNSGKHYTTYSQSNEPMFGYIWSKYMKIYRPMSSMRFRYAGAMPEQYCFGLEQLPAKGDLLFIVGGEKDVMSLAVRGFSAICFNSETSHIQPNFIDKLTYRFKHIVLMYDADETGAEHSLKHQQQLVDYGVLRLVLPLKGSKEEKDISDFFRLGNSATSLRVLFAEMLRERYSNTMAILNSCRVSLELPPPESEIIISINDVPLGTNGNLLCVTGGEGTGKSNFVGALIAGAINNCGQDIDTLGVTIKCDLDNKPILLYDTEQSSAQVFKNSNNIIRRAKCSAVPNHFQPYGFSSLSRGVRLQSITESMDLFYHQNGGIHLVVIDGIADLISGANNETESIFIVEELYRLAAIYNTCIVCVLHFIPNGLKLRGHLGSELQRKAAAIISIERDGDGPISLIKALKVRDGSPLDVPVIKFAWSKEKKMHCYIGEKQKSERKKVELHNGAEEIFARRPHLTKPELIKELEAYFSVKDRAARNYIDYMQDEEIIIRDPSNSDYFMIGIKKNQHP